MSRHFLVESPSRNQKIKQTLPEENGSDATVKVIKTTSEGERYRKTQRLAEVAGGTAAECAAVCCCCPCTLMHLLVLTLFKVPLCLCRKAHKRHRIMKKKKKLALLGPGSGKETDIQKLEREVRAAVAAGDRGRDDDGEIQAVDLEKETWDQFYSTGFWRSPSQRSTM